MVNTASSVVCQCQITLWCQYAMAALMRHTAKAIDKSSCFELTIEACLPAAGDSLYLLPDGLSCCDILATRWWLHLGFTLFCSIKKLCRSL